MKSNCLVLMFLTVLIAICCNPLNNGEDENSKESYSVYNYSFRTWNVYVDNVLIGVSHPNRKTMFVGNLEGTHSIRGSSNAAWWGPFSYTFSDGQNRHLNVDKNDSGAYCDTADVVTVNF